MEASQAVESCCRTTESGAQVCVRPTDGQKAACASQSEATISAAEIPVLPVQLTAPRVRSAPQEIGQKFRAGVLLTVACVASPCCTPILVSLVLAALAGTPAAAWIGHNLGWVYGGLTLLSVISFVAGWRLLNRRKNTRIIPVRLYNAEEKAHAQ